MSSIEKIKIEEVEYDIQDTEGRRLIEEVNNSIPKKTSELTNDSNFLTEHQSLDNYYNKQEIENLISDSTSGSSSSGGGLYKIYKITFSKPAASGATTDVSGSGNTVKNAIMEAAAEGKLPLIYNSNYYGFFFPTFTLEQVKTNTRFEFVGPSYSQYNSSNTGQVGTMLVYFNMKSNTDGELVYNANAIGAGQLMWMNSSRFLSTYNTKSYTPSEDYHPATKKYVDDAIAAIKSQLGI